jgi:hypothetical protein
LSVTRARMFWQLAMRAFREQDDGATFRGAQ